MRGSAALRTGVTPGGALAGPWVQNPLWTAARAVPSLDLRFADNKSLVDAVTGASLVTFTRASSGTFVGSDGVLQTAVTNLLLRSEEFDNASWAKILATVSANVISAPNGNTTADKLEEATGTGEHVVYQGRTGSNETVTLSVFCKQAERTRVRIGFSNFATEGRGATFDLVSGSVVATEANGTDYTNISASISAFGDGWFRCVIRATKGTANTTNNPFIETVIGTSFSFAGTAGSGIYLWGAQLEQSSSVGEYIPTTSTINSAPRFDHNPTTGESLGLLVEEQRTNSIRNNTMVGAVAGTPGTLPTNWEYISASTGLTSSIVGTGIENGINYLDVKFTGTAGSINPCEIGIDRGSALTGQSWAGSVYWKLVGGSTSGISAFLLGHIELDSGLNFVTGGFTAQTAPTNALLITQRPAATRTLSGGATVASNAFRIRVAPVNGAAIDITLRIGLPQLEQGAFATSPILTSTAAATRSADVCSITGSAFSGWYRQNEGTMFAEVNTFTIASTGANWWRVSDGTAANFIRLTRSGVGATPQMQITSGGAGQGSPFTSGILANTFFKNACYYKTDDFGITTNGSALTSNAIDTLATMPTGIDRLELSSTIINGHYKRLTFWPTRLPNNILQGITQ